MTVICDACGHSAERTAPWTECPVCNSRLYVVAASGISAASKPVAQSDATLSFTMATLCGFLAAISVVLAVIATKLEAQSTIANAKSPNNAPAHIKTPASNDIVATATPATTTILSLVTPSVDPDRVDFDFYGTSQCVTFTGGEPRVLDQPQFIKKVELCERQLDGSFRLAIAADENRSQEKRTDEVKIGVVGHPGIITIKVTQAGAPPTATKQRIEDREEERKPEEPDTESVVSSNSWPEKTQSPIQKKGSPSELSNPDEKGNSPGKRVSHPAEKTSDAAEIP